MIEESGKTMSAEKDDNRENPGVVFVDGRPYSTSSLLRMLETAGVIKDSSGILWLGDSRLEPLFDIEWGCPLAKTCRTRVDAMIALGCRTILIPNGDSKTVASTQEDPPQTAVSSENDVQASSSDMLESTDEPLLTPARDMVIFDDVENETQTGGDEESVENQEQKRASEHDDTSLLPVEVDMGAPGIVSDDMGAPNAVGEDMGFQRSRSHVSDTTEQQEGRLMHENTANEETETLSTQSIGAPRRPRFCPKCGKEIQEHWKFCAHCRHEM